MSALDNDSKIIPNSFQTPNFYVDDVMHLLTSDEYKVLSFVNRHILGWRSHFVECKAIISLTMLVKGYQSKKTGRRFNGTGLSRPTVIKCLEALAFYGLLVPLGSPTAAGQAWSIGEQPNLEGLQDRRAKKMQRASGRMETVRGKSHLPPSTTTDDSGKSHLPLGGKSHLPKQRHIERQKDSTASDEARTRPTESQSVEAVVSSKDGVPAPKERSAKQIAAAAPAEALAEAMGMVLAGPDYGVYGKHAATLVKAGVPFGEFGLYVRRLKARAKTEGWTLTVSSLTANGRISEYVTARDEYRKRQETGQAAGMWQGDSADEKPQYRAVVVTRESTPTAEVMAVFGGDA